MLEEDGPALRLNSPQGHQRLLLLLRLTDDRVGLWLSELRDGPAVDVRLAAARQGPDHARGHAARGRHQHQAPGAVSKADVEPAGGQMIAAIYARKSPVFCPYTTAEMVLN